VPGGPQKGPAGAQGRGLLPARQRIALSGEQHVPDCKSALDQHAAGVLIIPGNEGGRKDEETDSDPEHRQDIRQSGCSQGHQSRHQRK